MRIHEAFYATAARRPDAQAFQGPDGAVTFREAANRISRLANGLAALGIGPDTRLALLLENSVAFVISYLAGFTAGGVAVPIDPHLTIRNVAQMLRDCEPAVVILHESWVDRLAEIVRTLPGLRGVVVVPSTRVTALGSIRCVGWAEMVAASRPQRPPGRRRSAEVAVILYTSGTTGQAKGVMLTHGNLEAAASNIIHVASITEHDRELLTLPLSHLFGLAHVHCYARMGGSLLIRSGLLPLEELFRLMVEERITSFPAVPASFAMMLQRYASLLQRAAQGVRYMFTNSAPMPVDHIRQLRTLLPHTRLLMYYGLTEASRSTFIDYTQATPARLASVGQAAPRITVEIRNEQGAGCVAGTLGEVVIRGPTVTPGYWRNPTETEAVLKPEGLHTGDLGRLDEDGFLFLAGRIKELINAGGIKFSPVEIEEMLKQHPAIQDVGVVGVPDPAGVMGEIVKAYVVFRPSQHAPDGELKRFAMQQLEPYKVPQLIQVVEGPLPRTDAGKLARAQLACLDARPTGMRP